MRVKTVANLLIVVALAGCGQAAPAPPAEATDAPPTSTRTQQPSPSPTPAPSSTPTPDPTEMAQLESDFRRGYGTLLFLEGSAAIIDETAKQRNAGEISGIDAFGSLIAAGALMQGVSESLDSEPPIDELEPAWDEARLARDGLRDVMSRWFDDEITSEVVIAEMDAIWEHIQSAQDMTERVWIEEYGLDRDELREFREQTQQDLREVVSGTTTPAPSPTLEDE